MKTAVPYIAVVDDEAPVCIAIGRLLRLADYEVVTFGSGEEFLASLEVRRPVCVILDVHMPGLSGLDAQSQLRAAHIEIPVVFITASDDVALDKSALEAGGVRLLRKPFSNEQLLEAVGIATQTDSRNAS